MYEILTNIIEFIEQNKLPINNNINSLIGSGIIGLLAGHSDYMISRNKMREGVLNTEPKKLIGGVGAQLVIRYRWDNI